jgi:hypothetical protein
VVAIVSERTRTAANGRSALPPEDDNLMSQRDELKLQRCATANTEREQREESGQNRDHAPDGMAVVLENPQSFSTVHSFEQAQASIIGAA